jgi:hypothetical protein
MVFSPPSLISGPELIFIQTIYPGALNAPSSPLIPKTPFVPSLPGPSASANPPRTPWTPYTAFASKQNPFDFTFGAAAVSSALSVPLLDDKDDSLAALFNKVLRFVERDLKAIMEAAERVCVKSGSRRSAFASSTQVAISALSTPALEKSNKRESAGNFDILANVVWAEVARSIMDELGSVVFAAGKPDEFRKVRNQPFTWNSLQLQAQPSLDSTMKQLKPSFVHWNFLDLQLRPFMRCVHTPPTALLNVAGSCLFISNCVGRK